MHTARTVPAVVPATVAGSRRLREKFLAAVAEAGLPMGPGPRAPVGEADLAGLPATVQRYLGFMGVLGRPRDWSFRAHVRGRFRLGPELPWMGAESWQYDSALEIGRIYHMQVRLRGVVPVVARDTYLHGRGRMRARVFDLLDMVDEQGDRIDTGELTTWLNDAVLFAPSMLLRPEVTWKEVDANAFDVALTDGGRTVKARVLVDGRGAPTNFSTVDRFGTDPAHPRGGLVRMRWTTPIEGWVRRAGRPLPAAGRAVWHTPDGNEWAYADLRFEDALFEPDVPPAAPRRN